MTKAQPFEVDGTLGPIRGEVFGAEAPKGAVVICHGFKGFARWGFFPHLARRIADAGFNALTFDFSGSGMGADRENATEPDRFTANTFSAELSDVGRVVAYARSQKLAGRRLGLFGHSRGGGIAILHAASDPAVGALVTWNSISHVRRWSENEAAVWRTHGFTEVANSRTGQIFRIGTTLLDDVSANASGTLDVEAAAGRVRAPWLILHGKEDETVAPSEAERLHEASSAHSLLRLVEGNHGFGAKHPLADVPPSLESAVAETVSFFAEHLPDS